MTTYRYRGQSLDGAKVTGVIRAYDEFEAVSQLRDRCAFITKIEPVKEKQGNPLTRPINTRIREKELAMLCSQLSILLSSGLTALRCLQMVAAQTRNKQLRRALEKAAEEVGAGRSMADSLESNREVRFPATFVETVRAGEQSGSLEACLKRLQGYYERSSTARAKVVSAMTYPAMVIVTAIVVVIIVMVKAVPAFTNTFAELGSDIPAITRGLMAVSGFFVKWWWVLVLLGAAAGIGYYSFRRTERGRIVLANYALTRSPLRRLRTMSASGQFAAALSAMLSAGLPMPKALSVAGEVSGNYMFALAAGKVRQSVERGRTVAEGMGEVKLFPPMLREMISVGESSGTLVDTLDVVAQYFNSDALMRVAVPRRRGPAGLRDPIAVSLAALIDFAVLVVYDNSTRKHICRFHTLVCSMRLAMRCRSFALSTASICR